MHVLKSMYLQLSVIYTILRASAESRKYTARAEGLMPRFSTVLLYHLIFLLPLSTRAAIDLNDNHSAPWIVE